MRKGSAEQVVRKNFSLPKTFADRLEAIKAKRASTSDSEVIRQMIGLMEILTEKDDTEIVLRDRKTGKETTIIVA
jgi:metal-responsive CopG/Arc/MetJ family transcriptional regulator